MGLAVLAAFFCGPTAAEDHINPSLGRFGIFPKIYELPEPRLFRKESSCQMAKADQTEGLRMLGY
jgi:hypothetical protein